MTVKPVMTLLIVPIAVVSVTAGSIDLGFFANTAGLVREPNRAQASAVTNLVGRLKPFAFLLGDWTAVPSAAGETGGFSFTSDVQGHVIRRTNYADYPGAQGRPASRHDDLLVMAVDNDVVRADYYDSEGHIIRYVVTSPGAGQALFESEARPNEPRYRLRYTLGADGMLSGQFDVAAPDKPTVFNRYLAWTARRIR
jgi:hypothetical protein